MLFLFVTALLVLWLFHQMYWRRRLYPPGPIPIPLFGNALSILLEFPGQKPLNRWRQQYGKIFTEWLGNTPIVNVADYQTIQKMFVLDGESYSERLPISKFTEEFRGELSMKGNLGIIETSGSMWRDQRRFAMHTLRDLGLGKEAMQERILSETISLLDKLETESTSTGCTWPMKHIEQSVASVINLVIFGYRFDEHTEHEFRRNREMQDEIIAMTRIPLKIMPLEFPILAKIWPFSKLKEGAMKLRDEIEIHRNRIDFSNNDCDDFCDAYLKEMERRKDDPETSFHDKMLINVCLDLWGAGMEPTAITMGWGTIQLLHHPEVQQKLHEEYDRVIGSDRLITMADKSVLPYTVAFINEVQRVANIFPQNVLRKTIKEVTIDGVHIPKGTAIAPLISVLLCDPEVFPDPDTFNPSRFIDESGKLLNVKEFMPFSVGKRQCPGEGLARMELFLFFANLVHRFKISPKDPNNLPSLEKKLATASKSEPFEAKLERR